MGSAAAVIVTTDRHGKRRGRTLEQGAGLHAEVSFACEDQALRLRFAVEAAQSRDKLRIRLDFGDVWHEIAIERRDEQLIARDELNPDFPDLWMVPPQIQAEAIEGIWRLDVTLPWGAAHANPQDGGETAVILGMSWRDTRRGRTNDAALLPVRFSRETEEAG